MLLSCYLNYQYTSWYVNVSRHSCAYGLIAGYLKCEIEGTEPVTASIIRDGIKFGDVSVLLAGEESLLENLHCPAFVSFILWICDFCTSLTVFWTFPQPLSGGRSDIRKQNPAPLPRWPLPHRDKGQDKIWYVSGKKKSCINPWQFLWLALCPLLAFLSTVSTG